MTVAWRQKACSVHTGPTGWTPRTNKEERKRETDTGKFQSNQKTHLNVTENDHVLDFLKSKMNYFNNIVFMVRRLRINEKAKLM